MLLIVVFGVGTLGVASMSGDATGHRSDAMSLPSSADRGLLVGARQSLISYAALYPFMYGPRSAGPGHLPCPDTDSIVQTRELLQQGDRFAASDSPDPPCGRSLVAHGYLPRHIRLPAQRYAFHIEPIQIATYSVAGLVVNNPVNRIVNPSIADSPSGSAGVAAVISLPGKRSGEQSASVVVSFDALLSGVQPALAAWIIGKVQSLSSAWCGGQAGETADDDEAFPVKTINALQCNEYRSRLEACPDDAPLLLLVDKLPESEGCAIDGIEQLTIDNVPARQHWFVKNQWMSWVDVRSASECIIGPADACHLQLIRGPGNPDGTVQTASSAWIVLQWTASP